MHSPLHMTQQFLVATSKVKRNCSHTCNCSHTREPGNKATICHSFLCTFYCSLAFISPKYIMMIAVPSEILLYLSDPLYIHTPLALAWLKNIFFSMYSLVKYILSLNSLYILPPLYLKFPTLAFSPFEHNGSHTSQ